MGSETRQTEKGKIMTTKYCGQWIDLEPAGEGLYDEMIEVAQAGEDVEPEEPDRDEALEWGGVNYP
jgi:hypothetical protein